MALKAGNEVVGGNTLRRAAIESPNFVTGVSGWAINQDGSAEFNNVTIRNGQIVSGTALYYSGTPALGNLKASISAVVGTDQFGQPFLDGITSYLIVGNISGLAVNFHAGIVTFWHSAGQGQPWSAGAAISGDAAGDLTLGPLTGQRVLSNAMTVSDALAAGGVLQVTNTTGGVNAALLRLAVAAAGDPWLGVLVTGDTFARFVLGATAGGLVRVQFGSGAAALDCTVQRLSANVVGLLATDLAIDTAGRGLQVKEGTNAKQGTAILAAGSVVVANTAVTANSRIFLGFVTPSANAGALFCSAVTVGTGFTVKSTNGADTSTIAYEIIEAAP